MSTEVRDEVDIDVIELLTNVDFPQIFDSDDDAYNFYSSFAQRSGFSIRRHHVYRNTTDEGNPETVYKREFVCHRSGVSKPVKVNELESQRKRKASRCSCSARLVVAKETIGSEEKWVVIYFNNVHNHDLLDEKEVQFLPAYRNIPVVDQNRILMMHKAGCSINVTMRLLELEKGIDVGSLPFMDKDIRNFLQNQNGIDKQNDALDVLKLCKGLKELDDAFQYDYTIDENKKLEHIIWAFGDSIRAYESFGDVVVFDTTYRINRYDMPLGIWLGVDNHGNSVFFGCNFLAFVKGKNPQTILTDQDPSLKEAIANEFPNTKHAFCIWHILAKLPSWFSFVLGARYNDFKSEFFKVYHLDCEDDFEQYWKSMVAQFGLSNDIHIKLLYSLRQRWALPYLKDFFFAGMTTTGRSESINSYIKHFLDVGVAVQIRNQVGEEARMRQKYHNHLLKTSFPMEEHVASILTPYAFGLIQIEIELSTKYAATETNSGSFIVKHHTKDDGGRLVTWIESQESIRCSCKEFEFSGILCRHAIRVLLMKNYFHIPSKYLPFRWRRESSLIPRSRHIVNNNDVSSSEFHSLIQCLEYESLKTKERKQIATKGLEDLIREIKGMSESHEDQIGLEVVPNNDECDVGIPVRTRSKGRPKGSKAKVVVEVVSNNDECDVGNPVRTKSKGRPKRSRPKGGVEAATKIRHCLFPNCGATGHDTRNCPNKRKHNDMLPNESPNVFKKGWRNSSN
ncbi:protein FAR1-RELATED SEQUENCE 11-like [Trifolium pratense]|uniref:protein FAR1-RELATED SEQUENCE 11-like n=1 Tax=Trifolium pratense TaxID=57577 RepID=UPI001E68FDFD|nr:protein FAR1-RELATED SEQUENCE 11-like [Trifolium pratense]